MPILLCLQNLPWKGNWGGGGGSVFASFFGRPEDREFVEEMRFGASYSTSNKLLLISRHIMTMGLKKFL